jgi:hypothetical protein
MEDSKAGNIDRQAFKEEIRKRTIKDILWSKRRAPSSKQILHHEMIEEEDKEVKLEEPQKGYLPLNQHQKHHYHHRKKMLEMLFLQPSKKRLPISEMFLLWSPGTHKKEVLEI